LSYYGWRLRVYPGDGDERNNNNEETPPHAARIAILPRVGLRLSSQCQQRVRKARAFEQLPGAPLPAHSELFSGNLVI